MSSTQPIIIILIMSMITFAIRAIPFCFIEIFKDHPLVTYLAKNLPAAIMLILVVYSYRNLPTPSLIFNLPAIVSICIIAIVHFWKRNLILSMATGLSIYILAYEILLNARI